MDILRIIYILILSKMVTSHFGYDNYKTKVFNFIRCHLNGESQFCDDSIKCVKLFHVCRYLSIDPIKCKKYKDNDKICAS
jgi:hypothetical protein